MSRVVHVLHAGTLPFRRALALQQSVAALVHRSSESSPEHRQYGNVLILTEHQPPVYTVGLRTKGHGSADERHLTGLGAEYVRTNRGGLITFHGPGQLVAYPVLNLKNFQPSIRWYVCRLERTIIDLCGVYGVRAATTADTGVWVEDRKICAIGIHASRYITTHGLALNCNTDLSWFDHIVPCGLDGKTVTSLSAELRRDVSIATVTPQFLASFGATLECDLIPLDGKIRDRLLHGAQESQPSSDGEQ